MASLKALKATAKVAHNAGDGRAVILDDKATLGAGYLGTPGVGDTIDYFVPAGTRVQTLESVYDDCDTNGAPTFAGKWGYRPVSAADGALVANDAYFAAAAAFAQAAGRTEFTFKPITFEQDVFISFTVTAVAATLNPANPEIHLIAGCSAVGAK